MLEVKVTRFSKGRHSIFSIDLDLFLVHSTLQTFLKIGIKRLENMLV
jgi:hypothetical protein